MSRSSGSARRGSARPPASAGSNGPILLLLGGAAIVVALVVTALLFSGDPPPSAGGTCAPIGVATSPPPPAAGGRAVSVFWDGSGSMRQYSRELRRVVDMLDSSVLQNAGATGLRHFVVGDTVSAGARRATDAIATLHGDSSLQMGARRAGEALVRGEADAVLFVSDLNVEIPSALLNQGGSVCPDVPMPSTPKAGATFSRCLESALLGKPMGDEIVPAAPTQELFVTSFDAPPTQQGELHLLLVSLAPEFAGTIAEELARQLGSDFTEHRIVDTRANLPGPVGCGWGKAELGGVERSATAGSTCAFTCMDTTTASLSCGVPLATSGPGWLVPAAPAVASPAGEGDRFSATVDAAGTVTLRMGCGRQVHGGQSGRRQASLTVSRGWATQAPDLSAITNDTNVQDLYRNLLALAERRAPARQTTLSLTLEDNQE